jgi:maltose O-acetyltransferase
LNIFLRILRYPGYYRTRVRDVWYRRRFLWAENRHHKHLELGRNVIFYVPVRSGGCGSLTVGDGSTFGVLIAHRLGSGEIMIQPRSPTSEIIIGKENWFNNNTVLCANERIAIGNHCQIGDQVAVYDCEFHEINPATRNRSAGPTGPVSIGNNVWLGSRVMVLKGVSIGDNSVVGAMSVVTKSIPANCVAAGIPAKVIRSIE